MSPVSYDLGPAGDGEGAVLANRFGSGFQVR
jgi:hypothetical protein